MSSIHRLRKEGIRPDFEYTEENAVASLPSPVENVSRVRRRKTHNVLPPESAVASFHESSLVVSLTHLGQYQETFRHMASVLEGFPSLKGSLIATQDELACLPLVHDYLLRSMCTDLEEREWMPFDRLLRGIASEPDLRMASPAVVACALIEHNWHDPSTWRACNMTKLELWRVKVCYWDFILPCYAFAPRRYNNLHVRLAEAVRHINLGPVVAHGYLHILPIVEGYMALLQSSKSLITKEAQDGLESIFLIKTNLLQLQHALVSDVLDGLGFPADTECPPLHVCWDPELNVAVSSQANATVSRRFLDTIASLAERYCWMFVAAHYLVFPATAVPTRPRSWLSAAIQWDVCEDS